MMKKRIGVPFTGERVGGSHMSTSLLLQGLDSDQFEPIILVHSEGEVANYLRKRGIPFVIEPLRATESWNGSGIRRLFASFLATLPVKRLIEKHDIDLVHTQDHKAFQLWIWGTRLAKRAMILHWRGPYRRTILTRVMMAFADRIIVISRYLQASLPSEIRRRAALIYNPFDTAEPKGDRASLRKALRTELGVPDDAVVLAWIGNLDKRKQPGQFVDIVTDVADIRPSHSIVGILCGGPGTISDDPAWRSKLDHAGSSIRWLGFRDPIMPTLAAADALVVTAADEPFGRTVIEAMIAGVPVVAAKDGGYVEALEHEKTGLLIAPSDRQAFVDAICGLLNDPVSARAMTEAAKRSARDRFAIGRHVDAVEAIYRSALGLSPKIETEALAAE